MKLVWSPETASDAYIDTVKSCKSYKESGVAEFLSATAAGWNARLIVETWSRGDPIATSVGLAVAATHTCGRHVCIVPDEQSKLEYVLAIKGVVTTESTEVLVVGESVENAVEEFPGVDFMVVDSKRREFVRTLRFANLSNKGAVLVCKNATQRATSGFKWHDVLKGGTRVVRSVFYRLGEGWISHTWELLVATSVVTRGRFLAVGLDTWIISREKSICSDANLGFPLLPFCTTSFCSL